MRSLTIEMPPQVSQACQESCVTYLNHCGICKHAHCVSKLEHGRQSWLRLVCFYFQINRKLFFCSSPNYHYKLVHQGNSWPRFHQPRVNFNSARISIAGFFFLQRVNLQ